MIRYSPEARATSRRTAAAPALRPLIRICRRLRRCRRRWLLRSRPCCRLRRGSSSAHNRDVIDLDRTIRSIVRVPAHRRNLLHQRDRSLIALPEDGVVPVEMLTLLPGEGHLGDEKLRAVGVRAGIRVSQASGLVKQQVRRDFILEWLDRISDRRRYPPDLRPES